MSISQRRRTGGGGGLDFGGGLSGIESCMCAKSVTVTEICVHSDLSSPNASAMQLPVWASRYCRQHLFTMRCTAGVANVMYRYVPSGYLQTVAFGNAKEEDCRHYETCPQRRTYTVTGICASVGLSATYTEGSPVAEEGRTLAAGLGVLNPACAPKSSS